MRRVLVPLDGTDLSTEILEDAIRLAGPDGELVLTYEVRRASGRAAAIDDAVADTEEARQYLNGVAEGLRARGVTVTTSAGRTFHVAAAIGETARTQDVDMIACATHGRDAVGGFLWGSVAWKVLANSPVPVLLRHPVRTSPPDPSGTHRLMVPLDGSRLAEEALPLAQDLAVEWRAPIHLVLVLQSTDVKASGASMGGYLTRVKDSLSGEVRTHLLVGSAVEELTAFAQGAGITDVVMTTHGRAGLSRVFVGSVAHELIRRLPLPVIVVPALATTVAAGRESVEAEKTPATVGS